MDDMDEKYDDFHPGPRVSELLPRRLESLLDTEAVGAHVSVGTGLTVANTGLDTMQVNVRIRPDIGSANSLSEKCIHATSRNSLAIVPPETSLGYKAGCRGKTYSFSRVFDSLTTQEEFFEATAQAQVRNAITSKQKNCVLITYGTTAAGKTYTMEGTYNQPGLLPRSLSLLFEEIQKTGKECTVNVSQYEVYNERIYDLLNFGAPPIDGWKHLELKEDSQGVVFVEGLKEAPIESAQQALDILRRSSKQRRKGATGLNHSSSRSHSVFTAAIHWKLENGADDSRSTISFVDLAGSERAKFTGNVGGRLDESKSINSSLMTLRLCLESLRWNQKNCHAKPRQLPYRQSKITHLLRDVLHGYGALIFCVNISPAACEYDSTACVLQYAAMATQIGNASRAQAPKRAQKAKSPQLGVQKAKKHAAKQQDAQRVQGDPGSEERRKLRKLTDEHEEMEDNLLTLAHENATLRDELEKVHEKALLAESSIREAVALEMEELLRDMESSYKERLASETIRLEKRLQSASSISAVPRLPHASQDHSAQKRLQAVEQELSDAQEACVDLAARLTAAEAREIELAMEVTQKEEELERLQADFATHKQFADELSADVKQQCMAQSNEEQRKTGLIARKVALISELKKIEQQQGCEVDPSGSDKLDAIQSTLDACMTQNEFSMDSNLPSAELFFRILPQLRERNAELDRILELTEEIQVDKFWRIVCSFRAGACTQPDITLHGEVAQDCSMETCAAFLSSITARLQKEHKAREQQLKANAAVETELLEAQLERAAKDTAALQKRLHIALGCTDPGSDAPTPHFAALARARGLQAQLAPDSHSGGQSGLQKGKLTLKQALIAAQHNSPAYSPAIQWTATPDTVQVACGKRKSQELNYVKPEGKRTAHSRPETRFKPQPVAAPSAAEHNPQEPAQVAVEQISDREGNDSEMLSQQPDVGSAIIPDEDAEDTTGANLPDADLTVGEGPADRQALETQERADGEVGDLAHVDAERTKQAEMRASGSGTASTAAANDKEDMVDGRKPLEPVSESCRAVSDNAEHNGKADSTEPEKERRSRKRGRMSCLAPNEKELLPQLRGTPVKQRLRKQRKAPQEFDL